MKWVVQEKSNLTRYEVFYREFNDKEEAEKAYEDRKGRCASSTVSMYKKLVDRPLENE